MNLKDLLYIIIIAFIFSYDSLIKKPKIGFFFFIASYGLNQLNYLYLKISNLLVLCEYGYKIKIVIHHTDITNNSFLIHRYCFNQNKMLDIVLIKLSSQIGDNLAKQHRVYISKNMNEISKYDHIGYFENDMDFSLSNVKYYLYTHELIKKHNIKNAIVGFRRYEISECDNGDVWKSCPDITYTLKLRLLNNIPFIIMGEGYSAMWIVDKDILFKHFNEKEFVEAPPQEKLIKEYFAYFYWEKRYTPLIPLYRFDDCFVHHMSNKYIHHPFSIQIAEIYNQMGICKSKNGLKYKGVMNNIKISISYANKSQHKCVKLNNC